MSAQSRGLSGRAAHQEDHLNRYGGEDLDPGEHEGNRDLNGDADAAEEQGTPKARWERIEEILAAVNGRWALTVMRHLAAGKSRPSDLLDAVNANRRDRPLSKKVMHEVLQRLSASELVSRTEVARWPRETHYELTKAGSAILAALSNLASPSSGRTGLMETGPEPPRAIDPTAVSPAGVWDYFLGGKNNFRGDRETGGASVAAMPSMPVLARSVRLFQADAIGTLVSLGVRQFLDIGAGLSVEGSVHEITRAAAPEARIVYVDNDPVVVSHARALFKSAEGTDDHVEADLRAPGTILPQAARTLDLSRPVAILLVGVVHFLADSEDPWACVARLRAGVTGDLYIVITHGASDINPEEAERFEAEYNSTANVKIKLREKKAVAGFFTGMEMISPGLVPISQWPTSDPRTVLSSYVGIGLQRARRDQ